MLVRDLESSLLARFPRRDAEAWDHMGLSVGDPDAKVRGVLCSLDATLDSLHAACSLGCNVLLTHHPVYISAPDSFCPPSAERPSSSAVVYEAVRLGVMLTIMITVTFYQPAQAASGKYTGTYTKTWSVSSNMTVTIKPSYSVIVNKVTSTKVRLQLEKLGVNGSPIYATAPITAKRKGNTVSFKWKDTWGNSGTGTLKLYKGYVKLKVKQTYTARWNRSTLDTSGKYMKIYRQSGNTKMDNIDL